MKVRNKVVVDNQSSNYVINESKRILSFNFPNPILIVHSDESMHVRDSAFVLNKTASFQIDQALNYYQLMITIKEKF